MSDNPLSATDRRRSPPGWPRLAVADRRLVLGRWAQPRACGSALALFAADLVLDWLFRLDKAQRLVMLVLIAAAIGWLVYRRLVRPLSATMSDDALALQVEAGNKQLGQSLISALQLGPHGRRREQRGMSPVLVRADGRCTARRRPSRSISAAFSTARSSG